MEFCLDPRSRARLDASDPVQGNSFGAGHEHDDEHESLTRSSPWRDTREEDRQLLGAWGSGAEPQGANAMIGKRVGHYRITARLGAGGMGEVFLAEDTRLDRKAAIKFLPANWRMIRSADSGS